MITLVKEKNKGDSIIIEIIVTNEIHNGEKFTITVTKRGSNVFQSFSEVPKLDSDDTECLAYLIGKNARELLGVPLVYH